MGPLTTLAITRIGLDRYSFVLERPPDPEHPFAAPFVPCADVHVPGEVIQVMRDRIAEAVVGRSESCRAGEDPFLVPGRALFDAFLPRMDAGARDIRDTLRNLATPLLISTNEPETPWELLHDGEGFLGMKLALGRSLRDRGDIDPAIRANTDVRERRCLLVSDPIGDLPSAAKEAASLLQLFEARGFVCEALDGPEATFEAVLDRLAGGKFSIFHYAGHIRQTEGDEHGEFAFVLHGGRPLHASVVERCANAPEVVFLNGCQSAQMVEGLTRAFLRAGSRLVLGSLFDAPSRGAAAFSAKFYDSFLAAKPAGDAARSARSAVLSGGFAGGAWACFVLYGDPRFSIGVDPLTSLLSTAGLKRTNFGATAREALERAYRMAERCAVLTAAHLFAALVQGPENHLRTRLRDRGVQADFLASLLARALRPSAPGGRSELSVSPNAREALKAAAAMATSAGREATELDLLRGLVRIENASIWRILREAGVRPHDLDPDGSDVEIESVGPLSRADCDPAAWAVLCAATAAADRGAGIVGSPDLFSAMLAAPEGSLVKAFARLQIPIEIEARRPDAALPRAGTARIACSPKAGEVLTLAQANAAAAGKLIGEPELLAAFVDSGGGGAGAYLQSRGIALRSLTSRLFLEGGLLDSGRFSAQAMEALDIGLGFARQKEYPKLGRRHLLYGLLALKGGVMEARIREQGSDSELLADLLHATLPPGGSPGQRLEMRVPCLSASLLKVLCAAEAACAQAGGDEIGDGHLLAAWVEDGGGFAGSFLVQNNIRLRRLCEDSGGTRPEQSH